MRYILKSFFIFLIISFIFGNFNVSALANKKDNINFQQNRIVDSVENISAFNKTSSLSQEIDSLSSDLATTTKGKIDVAKKDYVKDEILVRYKNNKINLNTISGRNTALNFTNSKSLEKKEDLRESNISVLRIKDAKTVEQKIAELKNDPDVEYVEPNYRRYPSTISTNDTNKGLLWGLDNTGQAVNGTSGTSDADIDAPEAWTIVDATSSTSVIVAIIDIGVAYNHPDLIANMWDGTNCKDENGNALGNCNHGYDYEDGDKTPLPLSSAHGTHIAGIIGAIKNNNIGVIGVAQNVKIMAIKFNLTVSEEIKAIDFAIQNGAKIINASYVGTEPSQLEYDAINRFESAGGIFVAAAGNCGDASTFSLNGCTSQNQTLYPASYDLSNIISVTATDQNDALASFSNYGVTSVDVGAPGTNTYSTILSDGYGYLDGTSMATPYVVGLVALIEGYNSGLTYSQVKNTILTTGDDNASSSGKTVSGKRINAYSALLSIMADSSAKAITSFTIPSQVGATTINETDHTIVLTVPYGTVVTALVPTITTTGLSVSPASGIAHDFTAASTYTATAGDATTQAYAVTIMVATPSNITTITSTIYTVDNTSSTIVNIPYATASSTFLSNLTKGESHQTWNIENISSPVLSDNTLVVTAQDGITTKTYTTTVNAPSSDATLGNLTISSGTLSPSFSISTTAYIVSVSNSISSVTVTPTQNESHSTIKVNSINTTSGSESSPISLVVGSNLIDIEVIAEDTSTSTYSITVTRAVASSAVASSAVASSGGGGGGGSAPTIPVVTKKGDANGDNKVDKYDFSLMMSNWGKTGSNVCDFNSDGKVDKYDFSLLMLNWNK